MTPLTPSWPGREYFEQLLHSLFTSDELRMWFAREPDYQILVAYLPGANATPSEVMFKATETLVQFGLIEACLFERLLNSFPNRRPDIERAQAEWHAQRSPRIHSPLTPKYTTPELRTLGEELEAAHLRREELIIDGKDTTTITEEIKRLTRSIRQGPQLKPGDILQGRFRLSELIDHGGYASVWLAFDRDVRERVAVKVLHGHKSNDSICCDRFKRGARNTAGMHHPNIIKIKRPAFEDQGYHAYVMEYVDGGNLVTVAARDVLSESRIVEIFVQLCDALDYAHQRGFIHRDIKPSNILLDTQGVPRLTDFDVMKSHDTTGGTRTGANIGTICYSAPETWNNPDAASALSDVYSLGMTLVACLARKDVDYSVVLDTRKYLRALDASPWLKQLIARVIDRDPAVRPATASELRRLLTDAHSGTGVLDPALDPAREELERFIEESANYLGSDRWSHATYRALDGRKAVSMVLTDICKMPTGALVCGVSRDAGIGVLGTNIASAGGPTRIPVRSGEGLLSPGKVIVAPGGKLPCEHVFYIVQDDSEDAVGNQLPDQIRRLIGQTLRVADALQLRTIAYPLLLTGVVGLPRERVLRLMFETLYETLGDSEHVDEAFIVIYPYALAVGWRSLPDTAVRLKDLEGAQLQFSIATPDHKNDTRPVPRTLPINVGVSYSGSKIQGSGFLLSAEERDLLVSKDRRNATRILPYLTAKDVSQGIDPFAEQHVISFGDLPLEEVEKWPDLLKIVRERVKPERESGNTKRLSQYWWRFAAPASALYERLRGYRRCIVSPRIGPHLAFVTCTSDQIFGGTLHVHATDSMAFFACVQSRVFSSWCHSLSSTLSDTVQWSLEAFNTFPFPYGNPRANRAELAGPGRRLETLRTIFMRSHRKTLFQTYNALMDPAVQDPEIVSLRNVHTELDELVLAAYGWTDIKIPPYGNPGTSEGQTAFDNFSNTVLDRLSTLNRTA